MRSAAFAFGALLLVATPVLARAGGGQAAFDAAQAADADLRFADALEAYREAARADPSASFAAAAIARARYIEARAEGDFGPLAELERARRDPTRLAQPAAAEALAAAAERFPAGHVRAEARVVAGEALLRLHDWPGAEHVLALAAADPDADPPTVGVAVSDLVGSIRARGDERRALAALDAHPGLLPSLRHDVASALLRERLALGAGALLAAFVLGALVASARLAARAGPSAVVKAASARAGIAVALGFGAATALVASAISTVDPTPFLLLGAGLAAVVTGHRVLASGAVGRGARAARGAAAVVAALAAALLAFAVGDARYLAIFGL